MTGPRSVCQCNVSKSDLNSWWSWRRKRGVLVVGEETRKRCRSTVNAFGCRSHSYDAALWRSSVHIEYVAWWPMHSIERKPKYDGVCFSLIQHQMLSNRIWDFYLMRERQKEKMHCQALVLCECVWRFTPGEFSILSGGWRWFIFSNSSSARWKPTHELHSLMLNLQCNL